VVRIQYLINLIAFIVGVKRFEIGFLLWFQSRSVAALAINRYSPIQL
jgi:hypothetical protein